MIGYYLLEEFEPSKFILAWDKPFPSISKAKDKGKTLNIPKLFVSYWDGTSWNDHSVMESV